MITFDSKTKAKYMRRLRRHAELDQIVQGIGFDGNRGCAVGCTLNAYDHEAYERELGIPEVFARLEDRLHEGMPLKDARKWPIRFLSAVPVSADIRPVLWRWFVWFLTEECPSASGTRVAALYARLLTGSAVEEREWRDAAAYAYADADAYAAYAAAGRDAAAARAARAAYAAARAAAYAAAYAYDAAAYAYDAAYAAAAAAGRDADGRDADARSYKRQAEKLIELLREHGKRAA